TRNQEGNHGSGSAEQGKPAARAGSKRVKDRSPQNRKNCPRRAGPRQARRGHHQDPAGAAVAAGFFCKALTRHFFHVVRARESPSIARKIVISPAVALSALRSEEHTSELQSRFD